ncbi:MAG: L,D-transpeptidase family protein [Verrucomicrobiae bacterium]|nr:L,D-transpeptidase family protein [Verrucomicrobiae bacterium]
MNMRSLEYYRNVVLMAAAMIAFVLSGPAKAAGRAEIEAVTFATEPKNVYVPLEETAKRLRLRFTKTEGSGQLNFVKGSVSAESIRRFVDGTELISIDDLQTVGVRVDQDAASGAIEVGRGFRRVNVTIGAKRVEIDLAKQRLSAWQGKRLVLQTRISSGRNGRTPAGKFKAGPYKARKHYSSLYNNAPMPWSVQVSGNIFVHGFTSVPDYPASHGCIRVPLTGGNPAKFFFEWANVGTPIAIVR